MTVETVTTYRVDCDGCGAGYHDNDAEDGCPIRYRARTENWALVGEKDYCPICVGKAIKRLGADDPVSAIHRVIDEEYRQFAVMSEPGGYLDEKTVIHNRHVIRKLNRVLELAHMPAYRQIGSEW